jgi:AraC-like DNA-binding protein/mannose-6-phosphate isomerase-like protein (cupin superfamily)
LALQWNIADIDDLTRSGIIYFNSKMEMLEDLPCKMYRLTAQPSLMTHCHDYFQIWYVAKGAFHHTVSGERFAIAAGDIFVVSPFTLHSVEIPSDQKLEIYGCEFMPSFINERLEEKPADHSFFDVAYVEYFLRRESRIQSKISLENVIEVRVRNLMREMLAEYERRSPFFQILLKANLLLLLSILVRQVNRELVDAGFEKSEKYKNIMTGVIEYIHTNYHENLKLDTLCSIANLSRSTFCGLFKEWTGKTFNRYVTDLRIFHAIGMLMRPELSVTDVCYSTGFNELSYFCRIFKKYTGISPTYFRKQAVQPKNDNHTIIPLIQTKVK